MLAYAGGLRIVAIVSMTGAVCAQTAAPTGLDGTRWHLVRFDDEKGQPTVPGDPAKYSITFHDLVEARLDCNIARSTWKASGSDLHFGALASTHDACSPGSLYDRIARDWTNIRTYRIQDRMLLLILKHGRGQYVFQRDTSMKDPSPARTEQLRRQLAEGEGIPTNGPMIVFDSKGVEFGPWIRRFLSQVQKNWSFPQEALFYRGRSTVGFDVHKDGTITDIAVVAPSAVESFNQSVRQALSRSSPTVPLPADYPDERLHFTVTFGFNARTDAPMVDPPK